MEERKADVKIKLYWISGKKGVDWSVTGICSGSSPIEWFCVAGAEPLIYVVRRIAFTSLGTFKNFN